MMGAKMEWTPDVDYNVLEPTSIKRFYCNQYRLETHEEMLGKVDSVFLYHNDKAIHSIIPVPSKSIKLVFIEVSRYIFLNEL